jgi:hypothetical protein
MSAVCYRVGRAVLSAPERSNNQPPPHFCRIQIEHFTRLIMKSFRLYRLNAPNDTKENLGAATTPFVLLSP